MLPLVTLLLPLLSSISPSDALCLLRRGVVQSGAKVYHSLRSSTDPSVLYATERTVVGEEFCDMVFQEEQVQLKLNATTGTAEILSREVVVDGETAQNDPPLNAVSTSGFEAPIITINNEGSSGADSVVDYQGYEVRLQRREDGLISSVALFDPNQDEVTMLTLVEDDLSSELQFNDGSWYQLKLVFFVDTSLNTAFLIYNSVVTMVDLSTGTTTFSSFSSTFSSCCSLPRMFVFEDTKTIAFYTSSECQSLLFFSYGTTGLTDIPAGGSFGFLRYGPDADHWVAIDGNRLDIGNVGYFESDRLDGVRLPSSVDEDSFFVVGHETTQDGSYYTANDGSSYYDFPCVNISTFPALESFTVEEATIDEIETGTGQILNTYRIIEEELGDNSGDTDFCFPGSSVVQVQGQSHPTKMEDLKIGNKVLVDVDKYEPVYSFGHYQKEHKTRFLRISTNATWSHTLTVSPNHMVKRMPDSQYVAATQLRTGDMLEHVSISSELVEIRSISPVIEEGVFAPFTPSGTIVVDGISASNFATILKDSSSSIGIFSVHWLSHAFEMPHRAVCAATNLCSTEQYDQEGVSTWVAIPFKMSQWILDESPEATNTFVLLMKRLMGIWCFGLLVMVGSVGVVLANSSMLWMVAAIFTGAVMAMQTRWAGTAVIGPICMAVTKRCAKRDSK